MAMIAFARRWIWVGLLSCALGGKAAPPEWETLFDGRDLSRWKTYQKPASEPVGWSVVDRTLTWQKGCGHLMTREKFAAFELELEWKISEGGNSGVMFHVDEASERPWQTGPEIQILDDAHHNDGKNPLTSCGAIYSLFAPKTSAARPVGKWNQLRLKVEAARIQCWLNGALVVDANPGNAEWKALVAKSKFAPFPDFGRLTEGAILLQDHDNPVWYRAIRIRRL